MGKAHGIASSFLNNKLACNQKREGPKTHITLTALNEPRCPCSPDLFHTVQTFDLTQRSSYLLILSDEHHKTQGRTSALHSTQQQSMFRPIT